MKRIVLLLLVLAMLSAVSLPAFAGSGLGSESGDINVNINGTEHTGIIYYVVVDWGNLDFTYNYLETNIWDPEKHIYESSLVGSWDRTEATVKVTNHSNADVQIDFGIITNDEYESNVQISLTNPSFVLETGEGRTFDEADNNTTKLQISGQPYLEEDYKLGQVTVNISKPTVIVP